MFGPSRPVAVAAVDLLLQDLPRFFVFVADVEDALAVRR